MEDGTHPRTIVDGFELAKQVVCQLKYQDEQISENRELLASVCRTSLSTKLRPELANQMSEIVTDALLTIYRSNSLLDLFMVEVMHMPHQMDSDTRLVRGLVLDHGARHPEMPKRIKHALILACNVSLEYEKSEVSSGFYYKNAEERERMVSAERKFVDDKVQQLVDFAKHVTAPGADGKSKRGEPKGD